MSISKHIDSGRIYQATIENTQRLLQATIEPSEGSSVRVKDVSDALASKARSEGCAIFKGKTILRQCLQAWGYVVFPDPKTWQPMLGGHALKKQLP